MMRRVCIGLVAMSFLAGGCASSRPAGPAVGGHRHEGSGMLQHYHRQAGDPDWLVRAGEFHGHLGPWLVLGAMVGQDAVKRLDTEGYWDIEITVWLPPERQRQPWSCILDGLQVSSGATLGKQNIRMDWPAEAASAESPVVFVVRREAGSQPRKGYSYRLRPETAAEMAGLSPERLERLSRDLAGRSVENLFEVRPLPGADERR